MFFQVQSGTLDTNAFYCPLCRQLGNCLLPIIDFLPTHSNNDDVDDQFLEEKIFDIFKTREILSKETVLIV